MTIETDINQQLNRLYRTESSKILAALTRIFGVANLSLAEDALQETFSRALSNWQKNGLPEKPAAWLMLAAKNQVIDTLRSKHYKSETSDDLALLLDSEWSLTTTVEHIFEQNVIKDEQLRMMFWCCQPGIKAENQLIVILKLLSGFSLNEIASALLLNTETVKKRLHRTKQQLKQKQLSLPTPEQMVQSLAEVHNVLYLMFNEGLNSINRQQALDIDYCIESIALVRQLVEAPAIANTESLSLFALMHFHLARINSRLDANNTVLPIDLQNRSLWQQPHIQTGCQLLDMVNMSKLSSDNKTAVTNNQLGRFYLEASIAKYHCLAASFEQTDWQQIVSYYHQLEKVTGSPVIKLNLAIAMAYLGEYEQAIELASLLLNHKQLTNSATVNATLAHIHAKQGNTELALYHADEGLKKGMAKNEHQLMMRQINRIISGE